MDPTRQTVGMAPADWIDLADVVVGAITALIVLWGGYIFSHRTKRFESAFSVGEVLLGKRLEAYASIAPLLNDILCHATYIGHWREMSPADVIDRKRSADKLFYTQLPYFGALVQRRYDAFIDLTFAVEQGRNAPPKLRSNRERHRGEYRREFAGDWERHFVAPEHRVPREEVRKAYDALVEAFRLDFHRIPQR